jgi:hypothetical protein
MGKDLSRKEPDFLSAELSNPRSSKWEISRHVASVNQTAQIYLGVSTLENLELLLTEIPIPRFPIFRNERSRDTWPPSIEQLTTTLGFPPWKIPNSCPRKSRFYDSQFPEMGGLATRGLRQSDGSQLLWGFHHGKSRSPGVLTLRYLLTDPMAVGFLNRNMTTQIDSYLVGSPTTS